MKKVNVFELSSDELNCELTELLDGELTEERKERIGMLLVAAVVWSMGVEQQWRTKLGADEEEVKDEALAELERRLVDEREGTRNVMGMVRMVVRGLVMRKGSRQRSRGKIQERLWKERESCGVEQDATKRLREWLGERFGGGLKDSRGKVDMHKLGSTVGAAMREFGTLTTAEILGEVSGFVESVRAGEVMLKVIGSLPEGKKREVLESMREAGASEEQLERLKEATVDKRLSVPIRKNLTGNVSETCGENSPV